MLGHRAVGPEVFDSAETILRTEHAIGAPREAVFASLAGAEDWKQWLGLDVTYTSAEPHGVGATRVVRPLPIGGPFAIHERFFRWEPGHRLSFHFERSPMPVPVFAEDYLIEEVPGGRSLLRWTIAIDGGLRPARAAVRLAMKRMAGDGLPKLASLLESRQR